MSQLQVLRRSGILKLHEDSKSLAVFSKQIFNFCFAIDVIAQTLHLHYDKERVRKPNPPYNTEYGEITSELRWDGSNF